MGDMVKGLFGGSDKLAKQQMQLQKEQRDDLEAEKARLARIEEGRNALRGSRRGLLAFNDDDPTVTEKLGGTPVDGGAGEDKTMGGRRRRRFAMAGNE